MAANLGLPAPLIALMALLVAIVVCMTLGFTIERIAYRPLRRAPRLAPLITAIGVSILLQTLAMLIWGRRYHTVPPIFPPTPHAIAGATITNVQILIIVVSALIMAGLLMLVHFTKLGRAMRATAENPTVAGLMGVNINRVIAFTFVIGAALAAVAGVMVGTYYGIAHYTMGALLGLKAFSAAVLGGIGYFLLGPVGMDVLEQNLHPRRRLRRLVRHSALNGLGEDTVHLSNFFHVDGVVGISGDLLAGCRRALRANGHDEP